jgi:hypothetical protein
MAKSAKDRSKWLTQYGTLDNLVAHAGESAAWWAKTRATHWRCRRLAVPPSCDVSSKKVAGSRPTPEPPVGQVFEQVELALAARDEVTRPSEPGAQHHPNTRLSRGVRKSTGI